MSSSEGRTANQAPTEIMLAPEHRPLISSRDWEFATAIAREFPELKTNIMLGGTGVTGRPEPTKIARLLKRIGISLPFNPGYYVALHTMAPNNFSITFQAINCYYPYYLSLAGGQEGESYCDEELEWEKGVRIIRSVLLEEIAGVHILDGDQIVQGGIVEAAGLSTDPKLWKWADCWKRVGHKRQQHALCYVLRSWHGTYDREMISIG